MTQPQDLVQQGRRPPMTGLSTTAYPLTEEDWELATPATIALARGEGPTRTRLQEAFALIPMPQRAFPLHCPSNSVALDGVIRYVPLSPQTIYDELPVRFTLYGWAHAHQDDKVLEGIQQLMGLGFKLTDVSAFRTQRNSNIRSVRVTSNVMHDQLWLMLLNRIIELPSGVACAIKAVVPSPSPEAPMYHTWGVLNPDYPAFRPSQFPLELETRFEGQGIHLLFNPQRLRPEWLDTICHSGICDIVFRSTEDLVTYQELLPSAKPFLLSKISGQRANVAGQSIILKKDLGPYRLHLYNVLYTAPATIQALLTQRDIEWEGYDTMGHGPRLTHHIGFKADETPLRGLPAASPTVLPGRQPWQPHPTLVRYELSPPTLPSLLPPRQALHVGGACLEQLPPQRLNVYHLP